jgi:hypothetical protein
MQPTRNERYPPEGVINDGRFADRRSASQMSVCSESASASSISTPR